MQLANEHKEPTSRLMLRRTGFRSSSWAVSLAPQVPSNFRGGGRWASGDLRVLSGGDMRPLATGTTPPSKMHVGQGFSLIALWPPSDLPRYCYVLYHGNQVIITRETKKKKPSLPPALTTRSQEKKKKKDPQTLASQARIGKEVHLTVGAASRLFLISLHGAWRSQTTMQTYSKIGSLQK